MFAMFSNFFSMLSNLFIAGNVASESVAIEAILDNEGDNLKKLTKAGITNERANELLEAKGLTYTFEIPEG